MVTSLPVPVVEVSALDIDRGVRHAGHDRTEPFGQLRSRVGVSRWPNRSVTISWSPDGT